MFDSQATSHIGMWQKKNIHTLTPKLGYWELPTLCGHSAPIFGVHTCMYICLHIYIYTYIHTYIHTYIYIFTTDDSKRVWKVIPRTKPQHTAAVTVAKAIQNKEVDGSLWANPPMKSVVQHPQSLSSRGFAVEAVDSDRTRPLHLAARFGHSQAVAQLIGPRGAVFGKGGDYNHFHSNTMRI